MGNLPFLFQVLLIEAKQRHFLLKSLFFSFLYFVLALFLFNYKAYESVFSQNFELLLTIKIFYKLFKESFFIIDSLDLILLTASAFLFGLNVELVLRKLKFLKNQKSLHLTFGAGILSLVAAGCAGCGLSIASVLGIAGAIALLPYQGTELMVIAVVLLLVSLWYNLKTLVTVCKITKI